MRLGTSILLLIGAALSTAALACGDDTGTGGTGTSSGAQTTDTVTSASTAATTQSATQASASQSASTGLSGEGTFVAVGYGGRTVRSIDDGLTWVNDQELMGNGGDDEFLLRAVGYGGGTFVAAGWRAMTSSDAKLWEDTGETGLNWIGALTFGAGKWVAVGGYGLRATSTDGIVWEDHAIDTVASHGAASLAYGDAGGDRFVSTNDDGVRAFATDGTDWQASSGAEAIATRHVAFGNGVFVAIGGGDVLASTDGGAKFDQVATLDGEVLSMTFGGGKFVAVADEAVFSSTDGTSWEKADVLGVRATSIAFGHDTFIILGSNKFHRSTDASTWEGPIEVPGQALEHVTFGAM